MQAIGQYFLPGSSPIFLFGAYILYQTYLNHAPKLGFLLGSSCSLVTFWRLTSISCCFEPSALPLTNIAVQGAVFGPPF